MVEEEVRARRMDTERLLKTNKDGYKKESITIPKSGVQVRIYQCMFQRNSTMRKIITGNWDGVPIWREETAEEVLLNLLHEKDVHKSKDTHDSEQGSRKVESPS